MRVGLLHVPFIARAWIVDTLRSHGYATVEGDQALGGPSVIVDSGGADALALVHDLAVAYRKQTVVATTSRNVDLLALYEHQFVHVVPFGDENALARALDLAVDGMRLERPHMRRFTPTQARIITKTALGWNPRDIAHALDMTPKTVNAHWSNILARCAHARSRVEFLAHLFRSEDPA
jgi:DNA-binding NarL/FixJ family response regulator